MSESANGKKGARNSPWSRGPHVKKHANWQRMVGWGRVKQRRPE